MDKKPLLVGGEWDAGQKIDGPTSQRGRWTVKREVHRIVVLYHFYFPKQEVTLETFEVDREEAAKEYARQCRDENTIPDRKQKGR